MNNDRYEYEERIIAFIDILGFRALINETVKDDITQQDKLNELVGTLALIKSEFKKMHKNGELPYSFVITYFSDSIVLSLKQHNSLGLIPIFETLKRIQIMLIERKILLRGGVVIGKLIHEENIILGPAMNDAYDLESKSALYPRITIDPDVMEMSARENNLEDGLFAVKDYNSNTCEADFDNTYYIDYFSDVKHYLDGEDEQLYYRNLRALIRNGVKRKDIGIRMKYMWMLRKFNAGRPATVLPMAYKELDEINEQIIKKQEYRRT
jgi:hypothetical protein